MINILNGIYANILYSVRAKGGVKAGFLEWWCMTKLCHVPLAFQCIHGWGNERSENGDEENE